MILDEASSALDENNEKHIINSILNDRPKTIIMITHRIKTLDICNKVYEIKENTFRTNNF